MISDLLRSSSLLKKEVLSCDIIANPLPSLPSFFCEPGLMILLDISLNCVKDFKFLTLVVCGVLGALIGGF